MVQWLTDSLELALSEGDPRPYYFGLIVIVMIAIICGLTLVDYLLTAALKFASGKWRHGRAAQISNKK